MNRGSHWTAVITFPAKLCTKLTTLLISSCKAGPRSDWIWSRSECSQPKAAPVTTLIPIIEARDEWLFCFVDCCKSVGSQACYLPIDLCKFENTDRGGDESFQGFQGQLPMIRVRDITHSPLCELLRFSEKYWVWETDRLTQTSEREREKKHLPMTHLSMHVVTLVKSRLIFWLLNLWTHLYLISKC